jgi:polysaccharide biosynthesis transport protein
MNVATPTRIPATSNSPENAVEASDYLGKSPETESVALAGPGLAGLEGGITKYIEPLLIYKRLLIGSLLIWIVLGWLALILWPRAYSSTAKLQLLLGRESVGLDPSSTTSQTMFVQKTPEEDVNSALEILSSRAVAESVVDKLGAENILQGYLPSTADPEPDSLIQQAKQAIGAWASKAYDLSGVRDRVSDRERAVQELQSKAKIFAPKKSSTMIIEMEAKSPAMAQAIVQSIVETFLERHVNVGTTDGSFQFFETQARDAEAKLVEMLDQRKRMLQDEKMASVESKYKSLTEQLAGIEADILKSEAQLRRTQTEVEDIQFQMSQLNKDIVATLQTQPDLTMSNMRTALYQAELEERRLSEAYQENHPKLVAIRKQVTAAREALEALGQTSESESKTPNPTLLKLEEELLKAKTAVAGLESFLEKSESQKEQKNAEINRLLEFENSLKQKDREIDVATKSLAILKEKEEQARVIEDLRQQRISSIGIVQQASFVEKPISPKKPVLAAGFLFLGLMFGVGLVYLREFTRRTLRRPEEVERLLARPVLAELPYCPILARGSELSPRILNSRRAKGFLESCQVIQSHLLLHNKDAINQIKPQARTIGIMGVTDECGASTLAMALTKTLSEQENLRTTLIDLDPRKGTLSRAYGLATPDAPLRSRRRQLQEPLPNESDLTEKQRLLGNSSLIAKELTDGNSEDRVATLEELGRETNVILVDLAPATRPGNSIAIAKALDQVLIVVASDQTEAKAAANLIAQLEKSKVPVAGVVVNKSTRYMARWLEEILG